jgi:hypothetical protein
MSVLCVCACVLESQKNIAGKRKETFRVTVGQTIPTASNYYYRA